jgi:plastocyanin
MQRQLVFVALVALAACGESKHDDPDRGNVAEDAGHHHTQDAAPMDAAARDMAVRPDFGVEVLDGGILEIEVLDCDDVETPDHRVAVSFVGSGYAPDDLTIEAGDVVQWENGPADAHTITWGMTGTPGVGALFDETIRANANVCIRFNKPGTEYPYFCRPHAGFMRAVLRTR